MPHTPDIEAGAIPPTEITKQEAVETARDIAEETFRLLVNAVQDYAIFVLDPQGYVKTWNTGARRLKGYEAGEIIGKHFSHFYSEEDKARQHPAWELEQAKKHGTYEEEGWRVRKDGSRFWVSVLITALRDASGLLQGFGKVTRDLSQKKIAEDELREAYGSLEKRVEERTAELIQAKEQAEMAVQSRDEFFAIASHELRTPLTSLKLKSQIALRTLQNKTELSAPELAHLNYARQTNDQLDRLAKLVDDMLDLTRIAHGRLPMVPEKIDINQLVRAALDRMAPQFRDKNIPVDFVTPPAGIFVNVDPARIDQVVNNIFTNVLRYAPGQALRISISQEAALVRVAIQDGGPGIAAEHQEQIFNRYERLAATAEAKGLGIGLYISRSIVKAHSGRLYVESEPGHGATFIIELPGLQ